MNEFNQRLITALYQLVGNKGYMRAVEAKLRTIEFTPEEQQSFQHLIHDFRQVRVDSDNLKSKIRTGRFF